MKKKIANRKERTMFFLPITDYLKTRRYLWVKFLIALVPALVMLLIGVFSDIDFSEIFSGFITAQISTIAILISFSIAIITILVSADNANIRKLKETKNASKKFKPLRNKPLTLFQVLLSGITYNVFVEIIFLMILILFVFLQLVLCPAAIKFLIAVCIFFIVHILHILLETVSQMYLTFWKNHNDSSDKNV
jgi:hypothetical protein